MGYLSNVRPNEKFILKGGAELSNLVELAGALKTMDADTFSHHVDAKKNDFAAWVYHCITDAELSEKLKLAASSGDAYALVSARIKELVSPPDTGRPRPWGELPPDGVDRIRGGGIISNRSDDTTINDIELLASSISEESFIRAYTEGKFFVSADGSDDLVKESDAGIVVLKKEAVKVNWDDNYKDLPLFSADLDNPGKDFFHKITRLQEHVQKREKVQAKLLYTELKRDFESQSFDAADKKSIHALMTSAYRDILELR